MKKEGEKDGRHGESHTNEELRGVRDPKGGESRYSNTERGRRRTTLT